MEFALDQTVLSPGYSVVWLFSFAKFLSRNITPRPSPRIQAPIRVYPSPHLVIPACFAFDRWAPTGERNDDHCNDKDLTNPLRMAKGVNAYLHSYRQGSEMVGTIVSRAYIELPTRYE